ncbi:Proteinase inhibitor I3, Kunitz legume, partial [Parasponia andersonii]
GSLPPSPSIDKMKPMKLIKIILTWLIFTTTTSTPQNDTNPPVLDTSGWPLRRGTKYYIKPAVARNGGRLTMVNRSGNRKGSCAFYVGQEQNDVVSASSSGLPVMISPFFRGQNVVRENKNFKIQFAEPVENITSSCNSSSTTTVKYSTVWGVGLQEERSGRRLIETGDNKGYANYFHVIRLLHKDDDDIIVYGLRWCPVEICPNCRLYCGDIGVYVEKGKRLLALDGNSVLPVVFERA